MVVNSFEYIYGFLTSVKVKMAGYYNRTCI